MAQGPLDRILEPLDEEQRAVVLHGSGPLLVVAGPGSGKTRAITHRMAYLLATGRARPEDILGLAFTNKAAEEMRTRLVALVGEEAQDVWISTFHSLCLRLLREHGQEIGLPAHFVVFDEVAQEEVLAAALGQEGWYRYSTQCELEALLTFLTWRKSRFPPREPAPGEEAWAAIAARYQELLGTFQALDFDDLILRAVELLATVPHVREAVQRRWPYVFVDEYHDTSPSQYALLTLLAPPPGAGCTVVADQDQSIYGWRGGEPALVERFREDYRPRVLYLHRNYRSAGPIVAATQAIISGVEGRPPRPSAIVEGPRVDVPVTHHLFTRPEQETAWVVQTVQSLVREGRRYGDIAILYRTHRRGDPLEQALALADIPFQRVRRRGLFQQPGSEEVLRHLQLIRHLADPYFKAALTFPRVLADELTMLQFQRLAQREGLTLVDLARRLDRYPEVSPLTRAAVGEFLRTYDALRDRLAQASALRAVRHLFGVLEGLRSPYREEDRETLVGFATFLHMREEAQSLRQALDAGEPIALVATGTLDAALGGLLLQDAVRTYLRKDLPLTFVPPAAPGEAALRVWWGDEGPAPLEGEARSVVLRERQAGSTRYGIALQAWRLAQALLGSFEALDQERFVVYDLETTGASPHYDEVVEIGAVTLDRGQRVGPPFHALVRPSRRISREAQKVHGISQEGVRDAPPLDAVLPRFLAYLGDAILVGHNVALFDNVILDREMGRLLGRGLTHPTLDTREVASRLLPRRSHSLSALLEHFRLPYREAHRALPDAEATAALLLVLLAENRRQKELESLVEYLPLVAIANASREEDEGEHAMLREAARRVIGRGRTREVIQRIQEGLPQLLWFEASRHLGTLEREHPTPSLADLRWDSLRREWEERADLFASLSRDPSLPSFLDYLATARAEDAYRPEADAVTLMSLHNAKGKEFPAVIIVGVEEGEIPYWTAQSAERLAEERRVLYVGMTRAREWLALTSVRGEGERRRNPSRFLSGVPTRLIQRRYHY